MKRKKRFNRYASFAPLFLRGLRLRNKYSKFTMTARLTYVANLIEVSRAKGIPGCVVECGVWRGGMSAGMAEILGPEREYYLFDSFEGLPPAQEIDGDAAIAWQKDKTGAKYYDNCKAEQKYAETAMQMSGAKKFHCIKGWFNQTLATFKPDTKIALLRIDADWYDSVLCCLEQLHKYLAPGAIVILDDYSTWVGCSKAVHKFLADHQSDARVDRKFGGIYVLRNL
jgi:O-methyltransferase